MQTDLKIEQVTMVTYSDYFRRAYRIDGPAFEEDDLVKPSVEVHHHI
jgi:hypothetical protein